MTKNFARSLDQIQTDNGWSNERLADELGITSRQLHRWRKGEAVPHTRRAAQLAEKFGMSTAVFLGLEEATNV